MRYEFGRSQTLTHFQSLLTDFHPPHCVERLPAGERHRDVEIQRIVIGRVFELALRRFEVLHRATYIGEAFFVIFAKVKRHRRAKLRRLGRVPRTTL